MAPDAILLDLMMPGLDGLGVRKRLREDDDQLLTAEDGAAGVELAVRELPDLILMDPVMDGWEATRRLKASAATRHIPVIALTAHVMRGDEEEARAAGCDDYLSKAIDEEPLLISRDRRACFAATPRRRFGAYRDRGAAFSPQLR